MSATATKTKTMVSRAARIVANEVVDGGCHRLEAEIEGTWPVAAAGQFCMLSLDHPNFPLLPRPFSLLGSRVGDDGAARVEFMIMPVGKGSGLLCSSRPGDRLNVVGPLGHAFVGDVPDGPLVCVAGGYGVAPFIFLLEAWRRAGDPRADSTTAVFGARTAERLTLADRLAAAAGRVELCTDDGSRGFHGRVDARLTALVDQAAPAAILTCGPEAMMEAVQRVGRSASIPVKASLETYMGCGYAVCNGCAVAVEKDGTPDGYTYELACREGTVFDGARLHWNLL